MESTIENPIYAEADANPKEYTEFSRQSFVTSQNSSYDAVKATSQAPIKPSKDKIAIIIIVLFLVMVVFVLGAVTACIVFAVEISELKSETDSLTKTVGSSVDSLAQELNTSIEHLNQQVVEAYSQKLSQFNISIELLYQQLDEAYSQRLSQFNISVGQIQLFLHLTAGLARSNPAPSCAAGLPPSLPSGYYWVRASNGSAAVRVYCDVTRSCGGVTGGRSGLFMGAER